MEAASNPQAMARARPAQVAVRRRDGAWSREIGNWHPQAPQ
jgi:hypothetical protein